jgi:hypothetical protein
MLSKTLAVLMVASMTLGFAACGKSKSKPLSKADYIAKADAICKVDGPKADAASAKLGNNPTTADFAAFQKAVVPALQDEIGKIRKLKPPKADAATVNAIYDSVDAVTNKIKAAKPSQIATLFTSDPFAGPNKAAAAYGLKVCGK